MRSRKARVWTTLAVAAALAVATVPVAAPVGAQAPGSGLGLVCTDGTTVGTTANFVLETSTGTIGMTDGNVVAMWGFSTPGTPFQYPSPNLCVTEGQTVNVTVRNTLPVPISLVFPGQDDVLADGSAIQPQTTGAFAQEVAPGGLITYSFVANHPGTFLYQSGTNPAVQVRMGLFGALVVRPIAGPNFVTNDVGTEFTSGEEFLALTSDIDPALSAAVLRGFDVDGMPLGWNPADYTPRYHMLNGRLFPDTIAPNFANWLPSQPYGALARTYERGAVLDGGAVHNLPALTRYASVSADEVPFHPHGNLSTVVQQDGRPLADGATDIAFDEFSINISPGQTYDVLFHWIDENGLNDKDEATFQSQVAPIPDFRYSVYGRLYSGSPYLGSPGTQPVGASALSSCGEYYIISHNHALNQLDAWGVPTQGQITFMRIDPPTPNTCTQ